MIADYVITAQNDVGFSNLVADQVAALPEFDRVSAVRWGNARIDGDTKGFAGTDLTMLTDLLEVDVTSGDAAASADPAHIVMSNEAADELGVEVGDEIVVEFAAAGNQTMTVGAIYDNDFIIGHFAIDLSAWTEYYNDQNDSVISARVGPDADIEQADAALAALSEEFPQLQFETQANWTERLETRSQSKIFITTPPALPNGPARYAARNATDPTWPKRSAACFRGVSETIAASSMSAAGVAPPLSNSPNDSAPRP
jgi:hypothetical protein